MNCDEVRAAHLAGEPEETFREHLAGCGDCRSRLPALEAARAGLSDPAICKPCTKVPSCGNTSCGGETCILCPGQSPDDLPPGCNGMTSCPTGTMSCAGGEPCPSGTYCDASSQCCIGIIL